MAPDIINNNGAAKKINIFCLLAAIVVILVLPFKKEIWYDETVSILCSKGLSHDSPASFATTNTISSATLEQLNTSGNVFTATVNDNGNSFLYNYGLHWFTLLFGNSITVYMLFSKLCGIAALIAFYALCQLFLKDSLFTSVALILLATDLGFMGLSHEIRAYSMGIFFVTLAAVYLFKFLFETDKPFHLFLTALFAVGAVLSHFLTVYIILVFLFVLVYIKRSALFSLKNIVAILSPAALLALFFYFAWPGLHIMSIQNREIQEEALSKGFSLAEVFSRSMRLTAINFKSVFPAFRNNIGIVLISFLFVIALFVAGMKSAENKTQKRDLGLLFLLGAFSSLFLLLLSIKSHHYTPLYYRYYSFGAPFSCLFIAYLLYVLFSSYKKNFLITGMLTAIIALPSCALFVMGIVNDHPAIQYNHPAIASEIVKNNISKIEVPDWREALLVQSLLPQGYKIDYFRNGDGYFTLYKQTGAEKIPVIKEDH